MAGNSLFPHCDALSNGGRAAVDDRAKRRWHKVHERSRASRISASAPVRQQVESTALLSSFDLASGPAVSGIALQFLGQQSLNATVRVPPTTSTSYQVTLTYPGVYVLDGQTGGMCGRVQRITFAR